MKLRPTFLIIVLSFVTSLSAYAGCFETLNRLRVRLSVTKKVLSENEDSFMKRLDSIERTGSWLRRLRKNKSPAIHAKMSKRLTKLDTYLFVGDYATAHRELRSLFREVEFSSLAIRAIDEQLEQVKQLDTRSIEQAREVLGQANISGRHWIDDAFSKSQTVDALVDQLVFTRSGYEVKLGSHFQEYLLAKEHLEALLVPGACSSDCQSNTLRLLDSLGIKYQSDRTRFSSFLEIGEDVSKNTIRDQIDNHRLAVITRLKRERNAELFAVLSEFATQPAIVQKILFGLTGLPGMHKLRIVRLFKVFLDSVAQTKHVPIINQIVRSMDDPSKKLDQVLQHNGLFGGNEFIVSFARRSDLDSKRVWNQIVTEASNSNPQMADELLKADQLAKARGPLDLLTGTSVLPRWLVGLASTGGIGYFWFSKGEVKSIEIQRDEDVIVPQPPMEDQIPLEGEEDQELEDISEELSSPDLQLRVLESVSRTPSSKRPKAKFTIWFSRFISGF
tara:strand:- start:47235 stop:48743 length:1509 start_codon:yes stop_codon:yes gene_type:complete